MRTTLRKRPQTWWKPHYANANKPDENHIPPHHNGEKTWRLTLSDLGGEEGVGETLNLVTVVPGDSCTTCRLSPWQSSQQSPPGVWGQQRSPSPPSQYKPRRTETNQKGKVLPGPIEVRLLQVTEFLPIQNKWNPRYLPTVPGNPPQHPSPFWL